ncbi:hypothetical protein BKA66DRAFT_470650, partial [Pyrenochaeta sp. MPI-SDFR-AT-0127]
MGKDSHTKLDPSVPSAEVCCLLRLPDELLLWVAQSLGGRARQQALCALTLVNRRLALIVRDLVYCSPVVKPRNAYQLAARLLNDATLAKRVVCLEILNGDAEDERFSNWEWGDHDFHGGDAEEPSEYTLDLAFQCRRVLHYHGINDDSWRWAAGLQAGDYYAYIALLLIITPNLQQLILSNQYAKALAQPENAYRGRIGTPARPYLANGLGSMSQSLRELIILPMLHDRPKYLASDPWNLISINMMGLMSVTHLTIPSTCLCKGVFGAPDASPFPPNLQRFLITGCTDEIVSFLQWFLMHKRHKFLLLRELEACWNETDIDQLSEKLRCHAELKLFRVCRAVEHEGAIVRWTFEGN